MWPISPEEEGLKVSKSTLWSASPTDELWDIGTVTEPFQVFSKMGKTILSLPTGLSENSVDAKAFGKARGSVQVGIIIIKGVP